ncbi:hypothetical protein AAG570_012325 [Ranatra chinensis]|uniref:Vacuolar protein sorting-associated protein 33A n=1 Tax=Ranatra chinensis TaxID=642074 RepID=A0ABD0YIH4_9HEMI
MTNHLSGGKVNISLLQDLEKKQLFELILKCGGPKVIVWAEDLVPLVGLIAKNTDLNEHDVRKMFFLEHGPLPPTTVKNIIFISRPRLHLMDMIADIIHEEERRGNRKECHLFFVPRRSQLCEKRLQSKGVFGNFTFVDDLPCDIFPFDNDLMSMEMEGAFKEYYVENDPSCLYQAAQALMTLQSLYGIIPRVTGKGPAAERVWDLVSRLSQEPRKFPTNSQIDQVLLIDRAVDLISPLATQLTFEGLIDELFEIKNMVVRLPADKFSGGDDSQNKIMVPDELQITLNSADELFAEIRDKNFNAVGTVLSSKAKLISSQLGARRTDQTVQEIKQFVDRLPSMMAAKRSLATYTTIAELIKNVTDSTEFLDSLQLEQELMLGVDTDRVQAHIEDCIAHQQPLVKVLRLICLQSATNSGLKPKVLEHYKREILQTYGFQHILTLSNLEVAGLLKMQQSSRSYTVLRKTLRLTVEDNSEVMPSDVNYVHSVYAPLSVRLIQQLIKSPSAWRQLSDVLALLPGRIIDHSQQLPNYIQKRRGSISSQSSQNENTKIVLVFFLGGCTFAEISALRFLSQQEDSKVEFVIATTKLINGNSFINSLTEPLVPDHK